MHPHKQADAAHIEALSFPSSFHPKSINLCRLSTYIFQNIGRSNESQVKFRSPWELKFEKAVNCEAQFTRNVKKIGTSSTVLLKILYATCKQGLKQGVGQC